MNGAVSVIYWLVCLFGGLWIGVHGAARGWSLLRTISIAVASMLLLGFLIVGAIA